MIMKKHTFILAALPILLWAGCSDDKENIIPAEITNITSGSTPGAIQLHWEYPEDYSTIKYVKVEYYDHLLKKQVTKLASTYTKSMDIPDTRAKYGIYEFTLQTFSPTGASGEIHKISQVSEPAPKPEAARYKVNLTENNLYCCHLSTTAGDGDNIGALLDGNTETYFSTVTNLAMSAPPHYLQVSLPENTTLKDFQFEYNTRNHAGGKPVEASVWVSAIGPKEGETDDDWTEDGNWTKITDLTNTDETNPLPIANAGKYVSDKLSSTTPFRYFRLRVERAINSNNHNSLRHFFLSEFSIFGYTEVEDPEAPDAE